MKRRVISLLMSVVFLLTASVFSMSVMAASEPIVVIDDFEDYTGGQPASATYANNVNNLITATDATYGTSMQHKANCRLNFGFPGTTITSGKVYLGFDIKFVNGTSNTFAASYYNSEGDPTDAGGNLSASLAAGGSSGATLVIGGTTLFTVDTNWHSLEYVMDITTGVASIYHNGTLVVNVTLNTLQEKGFGFVRFQETGAPFQIDNLRLIASDADVLEMYAENVSDDENAAVALDFTRSVKNINSLTASDVTIKNVMTGNTLPVTNVTPVGYSRLNVEFDDTNAVAGAEYAVIVNGAEFVAETPVSLIAMFNTAGGDSVNTVLNDPISAAWDVFTHNTNAEATVTTNADGFKVSIAPTASNLKYSVYKDFDSILQPEGVITIESTIKLTSAYEVYPYLYGMNGETPVYTRLGGFDRLPRYICSSDVTQFNPNQYAGIQLTPHQTYGNVYKLTTELNFNTNKARYKINDGDWLSNVVSGDGITEFDISNKNNITAEGFGGFKGICFLANSFTTNQNVNGYSQDSGNSTYELHNVKITQALPNPVISKVRFVNSAGNEVLPGDTVDAGISKVKVYFSTAVDTATLDGAVTLTGDGAPTVTYASYDSVTNCATYNFSSNLMGGKAFALTIANTITAGGTAITNAGTINFATNEGKFEVISFEFDKEDLEGITLDDNIKLSVDVINTKGGDAPQLSYAVYKGKIMKGFNYVSLDEAEELNFNLRSILGDSDDLTNITIKGFLWESFETIRPLADACTLTNIAD